MADLAFRHEAARRSLFPNGESMANPTRLTWQHDGRNTDGSAFGAEQFAGWELEVNEIVAVSVPIGWETDGTYELPLADVAALQDEGQYTVRMRLRHVNGIASDWSEPSSFAIDKRTPARPFGLSVS